MKPSEHKTVQARILAYAEATGWTLVSREEAEQRRGFDPDVPPADRAKNRSLFFDDLLDARVLDAISQDIDASPAAPQPVDATLVERVRVLVADIEVDCGQPLPTEIDDVGIL